MTQWQLNLKRAVVFATFPLVFTIWCFPFSSISLLCSISHFYHNFFLFWKTPVYPTWLWFLTMFFSGCNKRSSSLDLLDSWSFGKFSTCMWVCVHVPHFVHATSCIFRSIFSYSHDGIWYSFTKQKASSGNSSIWVDVVVISSKRSPTILDIACNELQTQMQI